MHVFVSPRERAQQTFRHLFGAGTPIPIENITITEDIAEWDYGDYEGLKAAEIKALRRAKSLDKGKEWSVWRDGCEGGESVHLEIA